MGKRKSSKPPPKKQRPKLDIAFNCPFCNSNKSVTATLDYDAEVGTHGLRFSAASALRRVLTAAGRSQIGSVVCNTCNERFSAKINKLSEAVDVYSEWIDACEAENNL